MTSIEQLTKQHLLHLRSEENFTNNFLENATTHSNISIEFAIECLEEILFTDNVIDFDDPNLNNDIASVGLNKINELKQQIQ